MTNRPVNTTLQALIRDMFICPDLPIGRSTTPDDVDGWDSLSHAVLLTRVERTFGIKLNRSETLGLADVGDLSDLIERSAGLATQPAMGRPA